ncbi:MAG: hypothetical protein K9N23_22435 [Akkermansiaceae bacterium]|nr:hypothetical protein [Akkermansiaceae bacterium]
MKTSRLLVLTLISITALTSVNWSPDDIQQEVAAQPADKHHGTDVSAVLDVPLPQDRNLLWCATFQMAWDGAAKQFGRPLTLSAPCPLADRLNAAPFDRRWVDEAAVFTTEGAIGGGVLDQITQEAKRRTGRGSELVADLAKGADPTDLVFYALLNKELKFPQPFGKLPATRVGGRRVSWFGFTPEQRDTAPLLKQLRVHHYGGKRDFVIELETSDAGEQLLLARLPEPPKTAAELSRTVIGHCQAAPPTGTGSDLLAVPHLVIDQATRFSELEGLRVKANGLILFKALQTIDFKLDEAGVKLRSEAALSFSCAAQAQVIPRLIIVRPPFAVIMKRTDAPQPYFVGWFANADLLQPGP